MFERFFEQDTEGRLKALTLEWKCPRCGGLNFKILFLGQRDMGEYHTRCRYCKAKFRVLYPAPGTVINGEAQFFDRLSDEEFSKDTETELIKDYAEIEYLKCDNADPRIIKGKQKALEEKIAFAKRLKRK
jgi:transcription elongation factor Elf1